MNWISEGPSVIAWLALCGLFSRRPVPVAPHVIKTTGGEMLGVAIPLFL